MELKGVWRTFAAGLDNVCYYEADQNEPQHKLRGPKKSVMSREIFSSFIRGLLFQFRVI